MGYSAGGSQHEASQPCPANFVQCVGVIFVGGSSPVLDLPQSRVVHFRPCPQARGSVERCRQTSPRCVFASRCLGTLGEAHSDFADQMKDVGLQSALENAEDVGQSQFRMLFQEIGNVQRILKPCFV